MPKTRQQVDTLLARCRAHRDGVDESGITLAIQKMAAAGVLVTEAQALEAQTVKEKTDLETRKAALDGQGLAPDVRRAALTQEDANYIAQHRALSAAAGGKRQQADREVRNAARIRSLNHIKEAQAGVEVCVRCTPIYDDAGDVVGATHYRLPVEDTTDASQPGPPVVRRGLKSLLRDGDADIDADGDLVLGGVKVDPPAKP